MGKYFVEFIERSRKDFQKHHKSGNKSVIKKIEVILKELSEHPYEGTGKPEQLKGNLSNFWSRRLNKKDRIIYKVKEEIVTVYVISALGHYEDK